MSQGFVNLSFMLWILVGTMCILTGWQARRGLGNKISHFFGRQNNWLLTLEHSRELVVVLNKNRRTKGLSYFGPGQNSTHSHPLTSTLVINPSPLFQICILKSTEGLRGKAGIFTSNSHQFFPIAPSYSWQLAESFINFSLCSNLSSILVRPPTLQKYSYYKFSWNHVSHLCCTYHSFKFTFDFCTNWINACLPF